MPTRKPRPARSLPTCCDPSTSCDVAHVDAICAPPVPDTCPDCGMTADDHEGRRLEHPWCMVHAVFASRFERLTSRGTWAYRYDRIVRDGEVKFESRFWRDACHVGTGRAYGLPRVREFVGRAACSPAHEQVTINPVDGMRLSLVEPPAAAKVLPHLSFAALRAAHRRAFSGRRRVYGRGRHVTTLGEYDARAWREALAAQARPLSTKQLAALLNIYAGAGVDVTPYERLGWQADRRPYEAAIAAAHARRKPYRDAFWSLRGSAGVPYVEIGGRATSGGPAIAKALRERGLLGGPRRENRNEITPEGRALCEQVIPVLAVCAFVIDVAMPWTTIRREKVAA